MKKIIAIVILIILVFVALFFLVFNKHPENTTNNISNEVQDNIISINYETETYYFKFSKLEINQDNKTAKLYFKRLSNVNNNNSIILVIYDESDYLDSFELDLTGYNNYFEFNYENSLENAKKYSVESINSNASVG